MSKLKDYRVRFEFGYGQEEIDATSEVLKENRWVWEKEETNKLEH